MLDLNAMKVRAEVATDSADGLAPYRVALAADVLALIAEVERLTQESTRRLARIGHWLRSYDLAMAMGRAACERIAELEAALPTLAQTFAREREDKLAAERRIGEAAQVEFTRRQEIVRDRDHWKDRALLAEGRLRHPKV